MPQQAGLTMAEKVLARAAGRQTARPGEYLDCKIDGVMAYESLVDVHQHLIDSGLPKGLDTVWDPAKVFLMLEHVQPPTQIGGARRAQEVRELAKRLELPFFHDTTTGICHQMMADHGYIQPGQLVIGSDSHACMYGALNCAGTGIGEMDLAFALTFGELWFMVPESIEVNLTGSGPGWPVGKDIILYLAGQLGADFALYKSLEFVGDGVASLSMDNRFTLADHGIEVGAKFAMFQTDDVTLEYLDSVRNAAIPDASDPVSPDPDAAYAQRIDIDITDLPPQVAAPHAFDNVVPVTELLGTSIDQAVVGSCANGRLEDIEAVARVVEGRRVADGVRLIVSPASNKIYKESVEAGHVGTILDAGGQFLDPGCAVCIGMRGHLAAGEVCLTSTTRNYQGRMGSPESYVYLASPATVALSAVEGSIADPREVY